MGKDFMIIELGKYNSDRRITYRRLDHRVREYHVCYRNGDRSTSCYDTRAASAGRNSEQARGHTMGPNQDEHRDVGDDCGAIKKH